MPLKNEHHLVAVKRRKYVHKFNRICDPIGDAGDIDDEKMLKLSKGIKTSHQKMFPIL